MEQLKAFISGGFGGACLVAVGHPLDLIKVRLQTGTQYKGIMDCARQTIAKEGIRGLYRGMLTPLAGATPVFAVCFWGYDVGKKLVGNKGELTIGQVAFAGAFSAIPTTILMTPMERVKCIMQVNTQFSGPLSATRFILKESGIKGLFLGSTATLLRDGLGSIGYFVTYELIKRNLSEKQLSPGAVLVAGGLAGMANWTLAIPLDVLKSRLQTAPKGTYTGLLDVFKKTLSKEGPTALMKGFRPAMVRAFPANAACFFGMEICRSFLDFYFK